MYLLVHCFLFGRTEWFRCHLFVAEFCTFEQSDRKKEYPDLVIPDYPAVIIRPKIIIIATNAITIPRVL